MARYKTTMKKQTYAFTLLELLIVLSMVIVLFAFGLPMTRNISLKHHADKAVSGFYHTIQFAKGLAIANNATVTICPSLHGRQCANVWKNHGILVFIDRYADGVVQPDDQIILYTENSLKELNIMWKGFNRHSFLQFTPFGNTTQHNGTVSFCLKKDSFEFSKAIILNTNGRPRIEKTSSCTAR
ncbi:MAG: GspH/FimT family pseudopilin [Pseudomonadota bacterium]|nr:GspH/FimT family pseudopilin [Gammaproteobacteria bacterium]MBU2545885.1 GspH/FimT family pseudopilin [Gammaproteobacteria bacterium]